MRAIFLTLMTFVLAVACGAADSAPRAARSVHLHYSAPESLTFYNEVTVDQSTNGSYFSVCGFNHGYFGIQQLSSPEKKVVIFSVWDPGNQNDPKSVAEDKRVQVSDAAPDVEVSRFGNEGTGGKSMFKYAWKIGETYRFMIKAEVKENKTAYTGYFYLNDEKKWKRLVTFTTITGGDQLKGYYSFVEDFRRDTKSVSETRSARYGNGWVQTSKGEWVPLTSATFTGDKTPLDNIDSGVKENAFYLSTGGETKKSRELRSKITREPGERNIPELVIEQTSAAK